MRTTKLWIPREQLHALSRSVHTHTHTHINIYMYIYRAGQIERDVITQDCSNSSAILHPHPHPSHICVQRLTFIINWKSSFTSPSFLLHTQNSNKELCSATWIMEDKDMVRFCPSCLRKRVILRCNDVSEEHAACMFNDSYFVILYAVNILLHFIPYWQMVPSNTQNFYKLFFCLKVDYYLLLSLFILTANVCYLCLVCYYSTIPQGENPFALKRNIYLCIRNVGLRTIYTTPCPKRWHCS
jgi:hypothetical protein